MNFQERLSKVFSVLQDHQCDMLLIEDQINLYYMTGLNLSAGKLLVYGKEAVVLVDGRYYESAKKDSPFPVLPSESNSLPDLLAHPQYSFIRSIGFDSANTSYKNFLELQKSLQKVNSKEGAPREIKLVPIENPLRDLRAIKDPEEVALMREAASMGSEGYDYVCSLLKEGISEIELAIELEIFWKRRGSKALAFDPIIAFGTHSSMPHYRAGKSVLKKGDAVLIDIGVNYQFYHSDMTRVVFFGEPDPRILAIYKIVEEAQRAALALCKPGTRIGDLDKAARDLIGSYGYADQFTHSLGHGVGLEIHEYPTLRNKEPVKDVPLQEGMVITIEPGIYLSGIGGVRIEDTVVITSDGFENITKRKTDLIIIH